MASSAPRHVIVLDIDGTLLDAAPAGFRPGRPDFVVRGKEVRLRPNLGDFLSVCLSRFDVAVWTAAPEAYAEVMIDRIAGAVAPALKSSLVAIWSEQDCEVLWRGSPSTIKELGKMASRLGRPLSRFLTVDDTPSTYSRNISNALPVPTFRGSSADLALVELQRFLATMDLAGGVDVRGWMHAPSGALSLKENAGFRLGSTQEHVALPEGQSRAAQDGAFAAQCDDLAALRARSTICHIAEHVYLSNYFAAKDANKVQSLGITHILVCAAELPCALATRLPQLIFTKLEVADNPSCTLPLGDAMAAIDAAATAGGRILLHCAAGGSRSAAVACAWVARERQLGYDEALAFVRACRWCEPNAGFERQVRAFAGETVTGLPRRTAEESSVDLC